MRGSLSGALFGACPEISGPPRVEGHHRWGHHDPSNRSGAHAIGAVTFTDKTRRRAGSQHARRHRPRQVGDASALGQIMIFPPGPPVNKTLEDLLAKARRMPPMTEEERHEQAIGWAIGELMLHYPAMTRERAERIVRSLG